MVPGRTITEPNRMVTTQCSTRRVAEGGRSVCKPPVIAGMTRQAMAEGIVCCPPGRARAHGMLSARPRSLPMKLAILSRNAKLYSTRRLVDAARTRGSVRVLDPLRCYMRIASDGFTLHYKGRALADYDAVIPRIGASVTRYGTAVLRQFELMGCSRPTPPTRSCARGKGVRGKRGREKGSGSDPSVFLTTDIVAASPTRRGRCCRRPCRGWRRPVD